MRLLQIQNQYLYEGLDRESRNTVMLWESAGIKLREAQLTADQIQQLFAEIEKGVTAGGSNRTMLGKGKDAAAAVNKAWEDLKTKIQDSGPVKAVDQKYDDAIAKIEAGLGGPDNKVNQVIQRYRKFAKEHPVAQGFVYAALIAAAGISGAGLGGAAVLGLLKMSDKLLQGEKFSSAAYSGVKAGAMAFAASKLGDLIKGMKAGDQIPKVIDGQDIVDVPGVPKMDFQKYDYYLGDSGNVVAVTKGAPNPFTGDLGSAASSASSAASTGSDLSNQILDQSLSHPAGRSAARQAVAAALDSGDITGAQGKELIKQIGSAAANPEAAERAITQALQNVGGSAANSAVKSAGTSIADIAASTDIPSVDAVGAQSVDAASSADPFTVNGQTMKASLKDTIMKMSDEDGEKAYNAWKVLVGGDADNQAKMGAGQLLQQLEKKYAKSESIDRSGKQLSEGQVYLVFNRVCATNDRLLAEGVLREGPMDFFKGAAAKGMQKLQGVGKNLTTKVTADKLNSAWRKAGTPTDSEELKSFLQSQGVDQTVVNTVYSSLKIKSDKPKAAGAEATPKAGAASATDAQTLYAQLKKDVMGLNKKEKQRIFAYLQKQLGTV